MSTKKPTTLRIVPSNRPNSTTSVIPWPSSPGLNYSPAPREFGGVVKVPQGSNLDPAVKLAVWNAWKATEESRDESNTILHVGILGPLLHMDSPDHDFWTFRITFSNATLHASLLDEPLTLTMPPQGAPTSLN